MAILSRLRPPLRTILPLLARPRTPFRRSESTYITNPYAFSLSYVFRQSVLIVKYTTLTLATFATLTLVGWGGTHIYIELFRHPTPSSLSHKARALLRGAYVHEEMAPDLSLAGSYLRAALRIALDEQKLEEGGDVVLGIMLRLADDEARAGDLRGAVTEYSRCWRLLVQRGDAEGTRRAAVVAKKLGDLYTRLGEYAHAEEVLAWGIKTLSTQKPSQPFSHLLILFDLSLANLYATQRNFSYALPLYLQSLKFVQARLADPAPKPGAPSELDSGPSWRCFEPIIESHLSEVLWGMQRADEAMGWAQRALEGARKGKSERDCDECAGVVLNNLGMMLEVWHTCIFAFMGAI